MHPYTMAVIHGGPGVAGYLSPLAEQVSSHSGVVEPWFSSMSIEGQLRELFTILNDDSSFPVVLIGHSWGAWLSFLFTARFPHLVSKLVLIGAGSFDEKYRTDIADERIGRLTREEQSEIMVLSEKLNTGGKGMNSGEMKRFGELSRKADTYDGDTDYPPGVTYDPEIYRSVWTEASDLRRSGQLLRSARLITCPVLAIHGIYDPHPASGVEYPLKKLLPDFTFILLDKCGHYPWMERQARDEFFTVLTGFLKG